MLNYVCVYDVFHYGISLQVMAVRETGLYQEARFLFALFENWYYICC